MCNGDKIKSWRMKGWDIPTSDAAGSTSKPITLVDTDGDVIGISAAENYSRADLANLLVTVEVNSQKPLVNVPLTQLLPDGERQFYPLLDKLVKGDTVTVNLTSRTANSLSTNPAVLIFHYEKPQTAFCKK